MLGKGWGQISTASYKPPDASSVSHLVDPLLNCLFRPATLSRTHRSLSTSISLSSATIVLLEKLYLPLKLIIIKQSIHCHHEIPRLVAPCRGSHGDYFTTAICTGFNQESYGLLVQAVTGAAEVVWLHLLGCACRLGRSRNDVSRIYGQG